MAAWATLALGFLAGLVLAALTAPVGVSGAVFLLPVQLDVLHVPNPAVTPTNLLYNVTATPGALLRYRRSGRLDGALTRRLLAGTVPGVVAGSLVRVFLVPGPRPFRLVAGLVLVGIGAWLLNRTVRRPPPVVPLSSAQVVGLAAGVGLVGGVYGIGGGSILAPILVGTGLAVAVVAPAALVSTLVTSVVGALTFGLVALLTDEPAGPKWTLGLACGLGGLVGGYVGAGLQPYLSERLLRVGLAAASASVGVLYVVRAVIG